MTGDSTSLAQDASQAGADDSNLPAVAGSAVRERVGQFGPGYKWLLLITMLCGSMATLLAATTINVALPSIIGAFGLGQDQAQWMATAFLAASTIAMLLNAWAMSAFGPGKTYICGMLVFIAGSLLGSISSNYETLILSRAMQGIASGLLQPMSMFMIFQTFADNRRGAAIGLYSLGVVFAPAFGPVVGGLAVDLSSWRLVFIITVPLAILATVMAAVIMPGRDQDGDQQRPKLDWIGLLLICITLVGLLSAISGGDRAGWHSNLTLGKIAIVLIAGATFLWWESRHPFPALNLRVFRHWQFTSACLVITMTGTAIYGSTYLVPIFVQLIQDYSPTAAGVMMIPSGIAMVIGFPFAGRLADMFDNRLLLGFGAICFGLSVWSLSGLATATPYWNIVLWLIISRIGISFLMPPANTMAMRGIPPPLLTSATGAASFVLQAGGSLGVTILAVLLQNRTAFHYQHLSAGIDETNAEFIYQHNLTMMTLQTDGLPLTEAFRHAFGSLATLLENEAAILAFRDCFFVLSIAYLLILMFVFLMPKPKTLIG